MMRFIAVVAVAFLLCAGGGAAQKVDISQLSIGLDVTDPQQLKQVIGVLMMKMQGLEKENAVLHNKTNAVEAELRNKTLVEEELRGEITWLKKDRDALENKTQVIEGELVKEKKKRMQLSIEVTQVRSALYRFSNKTNIDYTNITVRLDQCEAETAPFAAMMNRRRIQEDTLCRGSGLTAMFQACCPSGSARNGHRILQLTEGCDALPETCSASCAPLFIEYFEGCQEMLDDLAPNQRQIFVGFYGGCQEVEQAAAAMLQDARPAMIFHVVVMSEAEAEQAQMFGGGGAPAPPIGQIGALPPSPSPAGGAQIAQEFRRVCTTANLTTCVPQCNRLTYGFLLSIEIDGRGTVMTCNVMDMLYAWVGQASLGGYIGEIFEAFFSSVVSGAAGTYMITLREDHDVRTELTMRPGQVVVISGDRSLQQPPTWGEGGSWTEVEQINSCDRANDGTCDVEPGTDDSDCEPGTDDSDCGTASGIKSGRRAFTVGEAASLSLSYVQVDSAIRTDEGAMALTLDGCLLTFTDALFLQPGLSLTMKSTTMTSTETMLLRDGMHTTFIGMDAQFGGNPSWVVTKSGETATGQVCDADGTNCVEDLCLVVDCTDGGNPRMNPGAHCVSPQGTCDCADPQGHGFSDDRCGTHTCCDYSDPSGDAGGCAGGAYYVGPGCAYGRCSDYGNPCACDCFQGMSACDRDCAGWDAECDRTC
eukprot:SAG31_NODE_1524_length_8006_cov_11.768812_3_plen_703_part_00